MGLGFRILPWVLSGLFVGLTIVRAANKGATEKPALSVKSPEGFEKEFRRVSGEWKPGGNGVVARGPRYGDLDVSHRAGFRDDHHTYFVVRPANLWRYATAGEDDWGNYTLQTVVRVQEPAPLDGQRIGGGSVFMNYQWGREAIGSDAGLIVRYQGPNKYYMVRISSSYNHLELWKTKGGVVQVKDFDFEPGTDYKIRVQAAGRWIAISVDDEEVIRYYDPVEPITSGKVGLGVRESQVRFSRIQVTPSESIDDSPPKHDPSFHTREWVGRQYIFDGNEPVAYIRETKLKLEEVKLVPGVMPMIYCDLHAVWGALRWEKEDATVEVEAEGETVKIYSSVDDKHGRCRGEGWVTLSYDPDKGYVWDKRVRVKILKDDTFPKWHLNVVDPKFYQTVAPATDKLPTCRNAPNYAIYKHKSGEIASFPVNHQFKNGATLSPQDLLIERGGYWVTTVDNWGAVTTLPEDNAYQYAGDYCYWGLDQHILPIVDGEVEAAFKQKHKKKAKKGDVYEGHARLYAWSPQQVRQALEKAIHPYDEKVAKAPLLYHIEPVNHFEKTVPLLAGDSKVRWVGDYAIDREEGRDGSRCMRIEAGSTSSNIGHHRVRAGKPPNMQIGPSFRTGPYPARLYRIGFWVRSKGFEGRVSLKIDRINYPPGSKEGRPDKLEESINLEEGSEWKHVALETPLPHLAHAWTMNIAPKGKGTLFVDDFEIVPIEQ